MRNKHQRWHDQIIKRGHTRALKTGGERHHILPRSLGGSNDPQNLVRLTYREHFLVHWLLTKTTAGKTRERMLYALYRMSARSPDNHHRIIASWQYAIARKAVAEASRGPHPERGHVYTPEQRIRHGKALKGNKNKLGKRESEASRLKKHFAHLGAPPTRGCTGMHWITDGTSSRLRRADRPMPKGFTRGRRFKYVAPKVQASGRPKGCFNPSKPKIKLVCPVCKTVQLLVPWDAKRKKYCSHSCYSKAIRTSF